MRNSLVVTSLHKPNILWFSHLYRQKYTIGKLDFLQTYIGYPTPDGIGAGNIAEKLNQARKLFLSGGYDYLVLIEDDNILLNNDDLERLIISTEVNNADIMYSPYIFRNSGNMSSCVVSMNPEKGYYYTAEKFNEHYANWLRNKDIIEVDGAGFGFTVISEKVVARIPFRTQSTYEQENWEYPCHPDITFMVDCLKQGYRSFCDFGIPNGHIHYDTENALLLVPDADAKDFIRKDIIQLG